MACSTTGSAVTAAYVGRGLQCKRGVSTAFMLARTSHTPRVRCLSATKSQRSEEDAAAETAGAPFHTDTPSIFDKIVSKEIPATVVFEDDKVLAFRDISPQAPVHVVLVPKLRDGLTQLVKAEVRHKEILGHLLYVAKEVAQKEGLTNGYRVVINDGSDGCQSVYHLHLHIIGGRKLKWPPG